LRKLWVNDNAFSCDAEHALLKAALHQESSLTHLWLGGRTVNDASRQVLKETLANSSRDGSPQSGPKLYLQLS